MLAAFVLAAAGGCAGTAQDDETIGWSAQRLATRKSVQKNSEAA